MIIKIKPSLAFFLISSGVSLPLQAIDTGFFVVDGNFDEANNLQNPIVPTDIFIKDNGNIRVKFEFNKSNSQLDKEACVALDYVQILANRDVPISYFENGEPIVSEWETVWERSEIRNLTGSESVEPLSLDLLRTSCLNLEPIANFEDKFIARGDNSVWQFQLKQGDIKLGKRYLNSSSDYQDAELRVGITYLPKQFPYSATLSQSSDVYPSYLAYPAGGFVLNDGESITTANRRLQMQSDGNLVLHHFSNGKYEGVVWASNTNTGSPGSRAIFQSDGNLVVYDANGNVKWMTGTNPSGNRLTLQEDGNLVLIDSDRQVLWATNTNNLNIIRDDDWQVAFKAEVFLSLHETIEKTVEVYDHKLTTLSKYSGWDLPSAYYYDAQNNNIGCFGTWSGPVGILSGPASTTCLPAIEDIEVTKNLLANRNDADVLVMCPGSIIPEHLNLDSLRTRGATVPSMANQPYPQAMADTNYAWCDNVERIERQWTDLTQVTQEGWMVGVNQRTGNLECIASNGICQNSLIDKIALSDIETAIDALKLETLVLTGSTAECRYKNNATFSCPSELLIESPNISTVVNAFQQTDLLDVFSLSFGREELSLSAGESITTHNRVLRMQHNGSLVLLRQTDGVIDGAIWNSNTQQTGANKVTFQHDGNLIISDANNTVIWDTATHFDNGAIIKLQGNGDLVIYAESGEPLWSTDTSD